jgi:hypothetical protein
MEATLSIPEPSPATVTLKLTLEEATALRILAGSIGEKQAAALLVGSTARQAEVLLGSASPAYGSPLRNLCDSLYGALTPAIRAQRSRVIAERPEARELSI